MPRRHLQFLSQLQLTFTCGDFFVVRPGVPLAEQQEDDLLWIREEFLQSQHPRRPRGTVHDWPQ
jgi:serine/threonine protein phosphatase 1